MTLTKGEYKGPFKKASIGTAKQLKEKFIHPIRNEFTKNGVGFVFIAWDESSMSATGNIDHKLTLNRVLDWVIHEFEENYSVGEA